MSKQNLRAVPLILRLPNGRHAGRVVDNPASLMDIGPSLLDYLGTESPVRLQGESFMPAVEGEIREAPNPVVSSLARHERRRIDAIIQGDWKFILYSGTRSHELLYNLETDSEERINLVDTEGPRKAELATRLQEELASFSAGAEPAISGATDDRLLELRSLGYVE